jgi:hypothetical protein
VTFNDPISKIRDDSHMLWLVWIIPGWCLGPAADIPPAGLGGAAGRGVGPEAVCDLCYVMGRKMLVVVSAALNRLAWAGR